MKLHKTLLLGAAGLALAHVASAQTIIRIAGSNGDRNATNAAIANLLQGETYVGIAVNGNPGTPQSSNFGNFVGGTFNGTPVTVKTSYLGATGGVKAVAGSEPVRFLPTNATGNLNPNPLTATDPSQYEDAVPDFAVSTNFQSTSPYIGFYNGKNYIELEQILTGVAPMVFLASPGFPGDNLHTSAAQALYSRGYIPLSFLTGNSAHRNQTVFAIGRNFDAGQRYCPLAEMGLGVNAVTKHYQPTIQNGVVTSHVLWPRETVSGVDSQFPGNGGFNSGANLVSALVVPLGPNAYKVGNPNATAGYYIGYATPGDAVTANAGGAKTLKWNGVAYSQDAVREGQYTLWLYTRVVYDPNLGAPGSGKELHRAFADAIANEVITTTGSSGGGILIGTMQVYRESESAPVIPTYL